MSTRMNQWKSIDSVPIGTMVLLCCMQATDVSRWCFVDWLFVPNGTFVLHPTFTATHWMPLPRAPRNTRALKRLP